MLDESAEAMVEPQEKATENACRSLAERISRKLSAESTRAPCMLRDGQKNMHSSESLKFAGHSLHIDNNDSNVKLLKHSVLKPL